MSRDIIPEDVERYCVAHTTGEDAVLKELHRTTYLKTVHPQMITGHLQGRLLMMISQMLQPDRILEIGTFTGYSAYCLSKGLRADGRLITIEVNEELEEMARDFFTRAGVESCIDFITGDAFEIIPELDGDYDLIYLDANKEQYPEYLQLCREKLKPGGFLLADNTLWGGKVVNDRTTDASSLALDQFNSTLAKDADFETVMLPIRDGLTLSRKIRK